jgi:hypothetical protein
MNPITPQELANLWYLKFEHRWVASVELDKEWRRISRELMKHNLADYDLINDPQVSYSTEIIKLKESYK